MKRAGFIGLLLALVLGLAYAMTPAGTAIQNQASASYIDSANQPRTTTSNLVTTLVQQVYAFSITPNGTEASPGQTKNALPGGQVVFSYVVTNNGNGTDTINLATAQGTADNFDLLSPTIYRDTNCNGTLDAGENTPITGLTLGMGQSACVLVVATVPSTAADGEDGNLNLTGTSAGSPTTTDTDNWARAVATTLAALTASKAASPTGSVAPGDPITYTISGQNVGGSPAYGIPVTVDGTSRTGILVADTIPTGLTVSAMPTGSAGAGTVLYIYDTGSGWQTLTSSSLPLTGNGTVKIGMLIEGLIEGTEAFFPVGAQYTFSFTAQVPSGASPGTSYANSATVQFDANGDGDANDPGETVSTNTTTNTVGASYNVAVGPYGYPEAGASGFYSVGGYTVARSGDTQTISSAYSGTTVVFRHTLKNTGNAADSFTLSFSGAPSGWACQLVADDLTTPISGPVGPVAANGTYDFALKCAIPASYTTSTAVSLTVTATSVSDTSKQDNTTDTVSAVADGFRLDLYGGVNGYPPYTQTQTTDGTNFTSDDNVNATRVIYQSGTTHPSANPGGQVVYRLRVKNLNPNGQSDNYQLDVDPGAGYTAAIDSILFYADADDNGTPDGAPITNTGLVAANQEFKFLAVVTLKGTAPPGPAGFTFRAKSTQSSAEPMDYAYAEVNVNLLAQVQLDPDRSGTVTSPGTLTYTHTLINNSNAPAYCDISGDGGSHGWTYQYSTDGTSWYSALADVYAVPNGGTQTIYVRVLVPAGEPVGRVDVNTVTARCDVTTGSPDNDYEATDAATETTTIVGGELRLQKSVDKLTAYPGETLTYTIVAENIGTGDLKKVIVADPIPAYTTFVSVSATATGFSGTYNVLYSTDGVTWSTSAPTSVPTGGTVYVAVDTNEDNTITDADLMPPAAGITITLVVQVQ
ncbi:hypothetical protein [Thermus thermophilus]|uniref:hypothetical protein n=1 Tax=Thermus thermophilus TaxID=274 RepID=UPI001FCD21F0|nr:hypothetical protein [Thermus thermophilus]BDG22579.1 hypothetical protein TthSNM17_22410 [Thermus thermophilus]